MTFEEILRHHFPNAMPEADFVKNSYETMLKHGFTRTNTIACVGICHDEATHSLLDTIRAVWGEAVNLHSLSGVLFLGKTKHQTTELPASKQPEPQRYVIYTMPHIAVGAHGEVSLCQRPGHAGSFSACGALVAFQKELTHGYLSLETDPYNKKHSRQKLDLYRRTAYGQIPNLFNLTKMTQRIILEDLRQMIDMTTEMEGRDVLRTYAIHSGVQIHGPDGNNYIWPDQMYLSTAKQPTKSEIAIA